MSDGGTGRSLTRREFDAVANRVHFLIELVCRVDVVPGKEFSNLCMSAIQHFFVTLLLQLGKLLQIDVLPAPDGAEIT